MKQYIEKLQALPNRIKMVIGILMMIVYYVLIVVPIESATFDAQQELIKTNQLELWLRKAKEAIGGMPQVNLEKRAATTDSLFVIINKSINERNWDKHVTDVKQIEDSRVQVQINSVQFKELTEWLQSLYLTSQVYVAEATLTRKDAGYVQATITFMQAGVKP